MISVQKDLIPPNQLTSDACKEKIFQALREKNSHKTSTYYYRHPTVIDALYKLYHSKCAYCETNTNPGAAIQIDHYRPKNGVKEDPDHLGYYWLSYEWSNIIPLCQKCNGKKSNHFPIEPTGKRMRHPSSSQNEWQADHESLLLEKPLLIHPEIDNPEDHIYFKPDCKMYALTEKGQATIDICDLNRKWLIFDRKKYIDSLINKIQRLYKMYASDDIDENGLKRSLFLVYKDMLNAILPENDYSRFKWFVFHYFEAFIQNRVTEDILTKLKQTFDFFLKNAYNMIL